MPDKKLIDKVCAKRSPHKPHVWGRLKNFYCKGH